MSPAPQRFPNSRLANIGSYELEMVLSTDPSRRASVDRIRDEALRVAALSRGKTKPEDLHYHALWRDKQSDYGGEVTP